MRNDLSDADKRWRRHGLFRRSRRPWRSLAIACLLAGILALMVLTYLIP